MADMAEDRPGKDQAVLEAHQDREGSDSWAHKDSRRAGRRMEVDCGVDEEQEALLGHYDHRDHTVAGLEVDGRLQILDDTEAAVAERTAEEARADSLGPEEDRNGRFQDLD